MLIAVALAGTADEPQGRDNPIVPPDPLAAGTEPTSDGTAAPAPASPAPAAPASTDDSEPYDPVRARAKADSLYLKAVAAWKVGSWSRSWRLCAEALRLEPEHGPARLLAGYSLLRMRKIDEGLATLDGLAYEAVPDRSSHEIRARATEIAHKYRDPRRRNQPSISVGNLVLVERTGTLLTPLAGYVFTVQVPVREHFALRADAANPWGGTGGQLDVRGPRFDVMAAAVLPVDGGVWHVDLAAGPAFWDATAGYWPDGWQPYFGVRAAIGTDVRLGRLLGLRYEMGASVFPGASNDLGWYAEPLDMRFALTCWFGK